MQHIQTIAAFALKITLPLAGTKLQETIKY